MSASEYIPYREIPAALGIVAGDIVLLTSDILKLAMTARKREGSFSADTFLDAFISVLGTEGTLLIPAYNFDLEHGDAFSVKETIPMTGSLAIAAMKRNDFIRTENALHSFLVRGKYSSEMAGMHNISSFGPDSPFAFLHEKDALMLFAGTGIAEAMTFTHYVEESMKVGYRRNRDITLHYTDQAGVAEKKIFRLYAKKTGYTMNMQMLEDKLPPEILRIKYINSIAYSMIRCKAAFDAVSSDIRENRARGIVTFNMNLYLRDIIKKALRSITFYRTTYGKIRSGKRIS